MKKIIFLVSIFSLGFASEQVLIQDLKGILFTNSTDIHEVPSDYKGIEICSLFVPDENQFIEKMEQYLNKPVNMSTLEIVKEEVIDYYKKKGYPVVSSFIPEQDITSGRFVVIVIIGRLGKIQSESACYFPNEKLACMISIKPGEIINSNTVIRDLEWINVNPFLKTDLIFEPGKELGETDIVLVTEDRFPLRIFGGYQNTGNIIAGTSRFYAGFNWGNAWGIGHQLNYQFMTADQYNKWGAHIVNYIVPLPWKNIINLYGAYVQAKPPEGVDVDLKGHNWQVTGQYNIPFVSFGYLKSNVLIGYEFKNTNNFLSFASDQIFDNRIDISQFVLGYEADINYSIGMTSMGINLYLSPGNMTSHNKDRFFEQERSGATSNYVYGKLRLDQTLFFRRNCSWVLNTIFQQSTGKLVPSEELSLGGYTTVRGYEENEVIGDNGILVKNELRSPPFALPSLKKILNELQGLTFVDFGYTYDADQSILENESEILGSLGVGLRYRFGEYINLRFDYGWQLDSIFRKVDNSTKHSRAHFGAIVAF